MLYFVKCLGVVNEAQIYLLLYFQSLFNYSSVVINIEADRDTREYIMKFLEDGPGEDIFALQSHSLKHHKA